MRAHTSSARPARAFTMFEIIFVIAIVLMLAVVILPKTTLFSDASDDDRTVMTLHNVELEFEDLHIYNDRTIPDDWSSRLDAPGVTFEDAGPSPDVHTVSVARTAERTYEGIQVRDMVAALRSPTEACYVLVVRTHQPNGWGRYDDPLASCDATTIGPSEAAQVLGDPQTPSDLD